MRNLDNDLPNILKVALGVPLGADGDFQKRFSAFIERHYVNDSAAIKSTWKLVAFVLDSETTVAVSVTYPPIKNVNPGGSSCTYSVYSGDRTLIYRIMKDFPVDNVQKWFVDNPNSPAVVFDGLYEDYRLNAEPAVTKTVTGLSMSEVASLTADFKRQMNGL